MQVKTLILLHRDEINRNIPYAFICQTMSGSKWNTGRRKRLFKERFTESERNAIYKLHKQAHLWYLIKGTPEEIKLAPKTLLLWQKLANFCYEL